MSLEHMDWSDHALYRAHGELTEQKIRIENSLREIGRELDRRELARRGSGLDLRQMTPGLKNWTITQMARIVLEQYVHLDWSIQGFGMLRTYLSKPYRLHIWHSSGKVDQVSTIHDHPWDFESYVVAGRITDVVYGEEFSDAPTTHVKQRIRCGPGGCALDEKSYVRLRVVESQTYLPGQIYSRKAEDLHESIPEDGTITLIKRTFREDTEHAWVCFPLGTEWVSAEPRKANLGEIERFVVAGLAALDKVQ